MDITTLLELSVKLNASDLHISPGLPPICRVHGELITQDLPILDAETTRDMVYSVLTKDQQKQLEKHLQLDFALHDPRFGTFRVNAFHQSLGIASVYRVIPSTSPSMDELGIPEVFKKILKLSSGLILVTGPTGCGKSTSLAAMIDYININEARHIITIEDPIEYSHRSKKSIISQRQVYRDTIDFNDALRAALREDPDVIMIGEMRDLETIRLALTAAETGHLVMATLHTSTAPRAVNRVIDVFPAGEKSMIRNLVSESLQAIICQTLVNRISGGRIAAFEIMLSTMAIRNLIREDKISQMYSVIQTSSQKGMSTLDQALQHLVEKNIISAKDADAENSQRDIFDEITSQIPMR